MTDSTSAEKRTPETRIIEKLRRDHPVDAFDCGQDVLNGWLRKHALESGCRSDADLCWLGWRHGHWLLQPGRGPDRVHRCSRTPAKGTCAASRAGDAASRLAVQKDWKKKGVGRGLLRNAVLRTVQAADIAGIRALAVHAKDEQARRYYEQFDFAASPADPLHLLVLLKDIRRRFGA